MVRYRMSAMTSHFKVTLINSAQGFYTLEQIPLEFTKLEHFVEDNFL